jgi:hypothetical protein
MIVRFFCSFILRFSPFTSKSVVVIIIFNVNDKGVLKESRRKRRPASLEHSVNFFSFFTQKWSKTIAQMPFIRRSCRSMHGGPLKRSLTSSISRSVMYVLPHMNAPLALTEQAPTIHQSMFDRRSELISRKLRTLFKLRSTKYH